MLRLEEIRDAVKRLVIDQDRAQAAPAPPRCCAEQRDRTARVRRPACAQSIREPWTFECFDSWTTSWHGLDQHAYGLPGRPVAISAGAAAQGKPSLKLSPLSNVAKFRTSECLTPANDTSGYKITCRPGARWPLPGLQGSDTNRLLQCQSKKPRHRPPPKRSPFQHAGNARHASDTFSVHPQQGRELQPRFQGWHSLGDLSLEQPRKRRQLGARCCRRQQCAASWSEIHTRGGFDCARALQAYRIVP